jgi:subtilase family serine protease
MRRMQPKRFVVLLAVMTATISVCAVAASADTGPSQSRVALAGSSPKWATASQSTGTAAATSGTDVQVYLAPRGGQTALDAAVRAVSTPDTPTYRHFLTTGQYVARFAPSQSQVAAVRAWLSGAGLKVTGVGAGNRYVSASGDGAAIQRAFGVSLRNYRHHGRIEQAPSGDVTMPANLAGQVSGVTGLSTPQLAVHHAAPSAPPPPGFVNGRPCSAFYGQLTATFEADFKTPLPPFRGTHPPYAVCGYVPSQLRGAYGVTGSGLTGAGATVAITDAYAAPTIAKDANQYATGHGDAAFRAGQFTQSRPALPFRNQAACGPSGWYGEETLDVEAMHGIAPAANVRYYASRSCSDLDFVAALQRVVDDNTASIVSNSWGSPSDAESSGIIAANEQVFQQGALQGIGFLFSSGDDGDDLASSGLKETDYPASDPWVTAVGGTSAAIDANNTLQFQAGWGTEKFALNAGHTAWVPSAANPFLYGAGGGFSTLFNRPAYQDGVVPAGSPPGRAVPDIALDADPTTGMLIGETQTFPDGVRFGELRIGGTSLASPLMAGVQALAIQKAGTRLGFANPAIYALAGSTAFTDVTDAFDNRANVRVDYANSVDPTGGLLYTVRTFDDDASLTTTVGWDDVTGVGSPDGRYFAALAK